MSTDHAAEDVVTVVLSLHPSDSQNRVRVASVDPPDIAASPFLITWDEEQWMVGVTLNPPTSA